MYLMPTLSYIMTVSISSNVRVWVLCMHELIMLKLLTFFMNIQMLKMYVRHGKCLIIIDI